MRSFYAYIVTNKSRTLYTGMTNDLDRRCFEHQTKSGSRFCKRYNIDQLVYYEIFDNPQDAIAREKQIKGWLRVKKIELIETSNPNWVDLSQ